MLLVAPGCLYIFCGEKVNRNSPVRSRLLSNPFRQFCNTNQVYYVPPPGFRINPRRSYLAFGARANLPQLLHRAQAPMAKALLKRIRPGTTGLRFTRAKESSVFRKTTEGLMMCCPNLSMMNVNLWALKETTVKIIMRLTLFFLATGIRQPGCLGCFWKKVPPGLTKVSPTFPKISLVEGWLLSKAWFLHWFLKPIILVGLQNLGQRVNFFLPFSCLVYYIHFESYVLRNAQIIFHMPFVNQCTQRLPK